MLQKIGLPPERLGNVPLHRGKSGNPVSQKATDCPGSSFALEIISRSKVMGGLRRTYTKMWRELILLAGVGQCNHLDKVFFTVCVRLFPQIRGEAPPFEAILSI